MLVCTYWFGQATLVHVIVACAPLPASARVVDGPGGAGHTVAVVAGVGRVVASVAVVVVLVVAAEDQRHADSCQKTVAVLTGWFYCHYNQSALPYRGRTRCAGA